MIAQGSEGLKKEFPSSKSFENMAAIYQEVDLVLACRVQDTRVDAWGLTLQIAPNPDQGPDAPDSPFEISARWDTMRTRHEALISCAWHLFYGESFLIGLLIRLHNGMTPDRRVRLAENPDTINRNWKICILSFLFRQDGANHLETCV